MRLTIAETIAIRALSHPERTTIEVLGDGPSLSYGEAWRRVVGLAKAIGDVVPGPHGPMVGLLLPNAADAVLAYLACQMAGVAAVPINSRLAEPEIAFVLEDAGAKLVLSDGELTEVAARAATGVQATVIEAAAVPTPDAVERPHLGETGRGATTRVVGYTSGTTGLP